MTYLANFKQSTPAGSIDVSARIPTDCIAVAVAVCIGLSREPGVDGVEIIGAEAPRIKPSSTRERDLNGQ